MRNLKKVLSLALAFVMLVGMMVVGAGAVTTTKDYTDGADVTYTEAVDVMSAIGVFNGANGTFAPQGDLTRAQAAKIITYMLLGQEAADKLGTLTAPYTDVAASYWAAGSIAYCTNMGIVSGIGNGQFGPDAQVTGFQFAKMLLVALGYDADRENLTGSDWSINVSRLALTAALDTGLDSGTNFALNEALNREEACQMAFNALKAPMVQYATESTSITVGGTPIVIGGSNAAPVTTGATNGTNISDTAGTDGNPILQFGERYFQSLYCNDSSDDMGRPAHTWQYGREDIGTYANGATFTFTASVSASDMEKTLRGYSLKDDSRVPVVNGDSSGSTVTRIGAASPAANNSISELTGNGIVVEVFADNNRVITDIVVVNTYLMTVKKVSATEVTLAKVNGTGVTVEAVKDEDPCFAALSALKADDYVLVTPITENDGDTYTVSAVALPQIITGALTRIDKNNSGNTAVTVAGTSYSIGANKAGTSLSDLTNTNLTANTKTDAVLYLDTYGYAVHIEDVGTVTNYLYIISTYQSMVGSKVVTMAHGVAPDGTIVDINIGSYGGGNTSWGKATTGNLVSYTSASATDVDLYGAEYALDNVGDATTSSHDGKKIDLEAKTITQGTTHLASAIGATAVAYANNVKFIYFNSTDNSITVLDGVQTMTGGEHDIALVQDNAAGEPLITAVFIQGEAPNTAGSQILYVVGDKGTTTVDGSAARMWEVYIDGVKKTITVRGTDALAADTFHLYSYDEAKDLYTVTTAVYDQTDKVTSVKSNVLTDVVDNRLISFDGGTSYLNAANAEVIDLRQGGKADSVKELSELLDQGNNVTVSIIYNNATGDKDQGIVSYIFINSAVIPDTASITSVGSPVVSFTNKTAENGKAVPTASVADLTASGTDTASGTGSFTVTIKSGGQTTTTSDTVTLPLTLAEGASVGLKAPVTGVDVNESNEVVLTCQDTNNTWASSFVLSVTKGESKTEYTVDVTVASTTIGGATTGDAELTSSAGSLTSDTKGTVGSVDAATGKADITIASTALSGTLAANDTIKITVTVAGTGVEVQGESAGTTKKQVTLTYSGTAWSTATVVAVAPAGNTVTYTVKVA